MKSLLQLAKTTCILVIIINTDCLQAQCTANFSYTLGANGVVTFSSTSVGTNSTTSYYWNFGNGTNSGWGSNLSTTTQTYYTNGSFIVSLTLFGSPSCTSGISQTITVTNATTPTCNLSASLTFTNGSGGNVSFNSTSTGTVGQTTYLWNWGDGTQNNAGASTSHIYANNGTYTVTLTANNNFTPICVSSQTALVVVNNGPCNLFPSFNFTFGPNGTVTFSSTTTSSNPISWYNWSFGNATYSSGVNVPVPTATYYANGAYLITLGVMVSPSNCSMTISQTITVSNVTTPTCNLVAGFSHTNGTAGQVNFSSTSTGTIGQTTYTWNWGDGTSTGFGPTNTKYYANNGVYIVTLTANNHYTPACISTQTALVTVSNATCNLVPSFTYTYGPNGLVTFSNTSTGSGPITWYNWFFSNSASISGTNLPVVSHTYSVNGNYTVYLGVMISSWNCSLTTSQVINITNTGVMPCNLVAGFTSTPMSGGTYNFQNTSTGTNTNTVYNWNFGDGSTSSQQSPTHVYASSGNYLVSLTLSDPTNSTCVNVSTQTIFVSGIPCVANSGFTFVPTNTAQVWNAIPAFPWNVSSAVWNWGDGSTSNQLYTSHNYSVAGLYNICLHVTVTCASSSSTCASYSITRSTANVIQVNVIEPGLVNAGQELSVDSPLDFRIFPNPSDGEFSIILKGLPAGPVRVSIHNLLGAKIYDSGEEMLQFDWKKEIKVQDVSKGIYLIQIEALNTSFTKKVVFE